MLAVLLPYSPIPHTGCTAIVQKSKCIDLNITFDQACQFIVSCGVVVPPHELCNGGDRRAKESRVWKADNLSQAASRLSSFDF